MGIVALVTYGPISFLIASFEGVSRKADNDISVDDLVAVALFVDWAIHVPHRLTAHLL